MKSWHKSLPAESPAGEVCLRASRRWVGNRTAELSRPELEFVCLFFLGMMRRHWRVLSEGKS